MAAMSRKDAIREYKERVTPQGIYAIRCTATGQCWVGATRNLDAQRNSTWFQLNAGAYRHAELQAAWKRHGESAFLFEPLEALAEDISPIAVDDVMKERRLHWVREAGGIELR